MKRFDAILKVNKQSIFFMLSMLFISLHSFAFQPADIEYVEYRGEVVNASNGRAIA